MKVRITFDLGPDERHAIANYFGDKKFASRETIKTFIESQVRATIRGLVAEAEAADKETA